MPPGDETTRGMLRAFGLGQRIAATGARRLFVRFCREVEFFADGIDVEITPFELRFSDPHGFSVVVSPYRELFIVSIGRSRAFDVRVSSRESFCVALDATLRHFLEVQGKASSLAAVHG